MVRVLGDGLLRAPGKLGVEAPVNTRSCSRRRADDPEIGHGFMATAVLLAAGHS